jgi:hypothetical protein
MTKDTTKAKGGGIHFPVPKGKHGAPLVPGQDARKKPVNPTPRVVARTKASTKGR